MIASANKHYTSIRFRFRPDFENESGTFVWLHNSEVCEMITVDGVTGPIHFKERRGRVGERREEMEG